AIKVSEAMEPDPVTAAPTMEVDELRRIMLQHHARYVPVMEGTTLLGVVSFHDVAKAVLEEKSFENKMLKAYIKDWPEEEAP
ncbi:MAG: CBS domain-containing protein, partial [Betaproteobacteria bacterium]|nr:CBS domain-containing protein [Betaproteobacteria bacterium]